MHGSFKMIELNQLIECVNPISLREYGRNTMKQESQKRQINRDNSTKIDQMAYSTDKDKDKENIVYIGYDQGSKEEDKYGILSVEIKGGCKRCARDVCALFKRCKGWYLNTA
eukprot:102159_1